MTPRSLQAVLRTLSDAGSSVADGELLGRFRGGDEAAFAELVRRHGRLVWAVCRAGTNSDAEADDAFQATFLVLVRNAGKVRDAGKLSAWLHGVAFKVCAKARQGTKRRTARERATARREGNGTVVPESAWDRALAAVHEEVATLPDALRVPFVLCCLEGKGVTEAAEQLGWKLGTLSGRLTRAKDALLAKLDARGLTLGVVAAVGLAVPPAAAVAKATSLARVGAVIPGSILQLTQGVIGMSATSVKVLAATVLLACGLGLSVGGGWVATAEAQQPGPGAKAKADAEAEIKRLQAELDRVRALTEQATKKAADAEARARADADEARAKTTEKLLYLRALEAATKAKAGTVPEDTATFKTAKSEYTLIQVSDLSQTKFRELVERYEGKGWEYCGTSPMVDPKVLVWIFRRPLKGATTGALYEAYAPKYAVKPPAVEGAKPSDPIAIYKPISVVETVKSANTAGKAVGAEVKAVEAEIAKLTAKLAELKKGAAAPAGSEVKFDKASSPLQPQTLAKLIWELGFKKFGGRLKSVVALDDGGVIVHGDKEALEWATALVKSLAGK